MTSKYSLGERVLLKHDHPLIKGMPAGIEGVVWLVYDMVPSHYEVIWTFTDGEELQAIMYDEELTSPSNITSENPLIMTSLYHIGDHVILKYDHHLIESMKAGAEGIILFVYGGLPSLYEVIFTDPNGKEFQVGMQDKDLTSPSSPDYDNAPEPLIIPDGPPAG